MSITKPVNKIEKFTPLDKASYGYLTGLIDELCPEGVAFKALGEVILSLKTGLNPRKNFVLNAPNAENCYITVRELNGINVQFFDRTDKVTDEALQLINNRSNLDAGDVLFSGTGTVGRTALIKEKPKNWNIKEGVYTVKPDKKAINSQFLLFYLNSIHAKVEYEKKIVGSPVISLPMKELKQIKIPIPPLTIQKEIVKILDNFTQLEAELEAELEARKKQYEHYREELLTFGDDVEFRELGDCIDFTNGKGHEKNIDENGEYIVVNSKFVSTEGRVKKYSIEQICPIFKNDILMVMSDLPNGKALAKCFYVDGNDKYTLNPGRPPKVYHLWPLVIAPPVLSLTRDEEGKRHGYSNTYPPHRAKI